MTLAVHLGCRSFAPKGGDVTCVTVYPSDYGLQRMAEEAAMGPKVRYTGRRGCYDGSQVRWELW